MGVSDFVGEKLGLSEPSARFLVALYAGEVLKHAAQYMQYRSHVPALAAVLYN